VKEICSRIGSEDYNMPQELPLISTVKKTVSKKHKITVHPDIRPIDFYTNATKTAATAPKIPPAPTKPLNLAAAPLLEVVVVVAAAVVVVL